MLVHVGDVVAGWCAIAPRAHHRRLLNSRIIPVLDGRDTGVAACSVVRAGFRGHGLMHQLLARAVGHAEAHDAEVVDGHPVGTGGSRVDVISGHGGTTALFERAGFERAAPTTGRSGGRPRRVMRTVLR